MPSSGPNSLVTEQILSEELGLTPPATSTPYMTVLSALLAMMMTLTATIKSPSLILLVPNSGLGSQEAGKVVLISHWACM